MHPLKYSPIGKKLTLKAENIDLTVFLQVFQWVKYWVPFLLLWMFIMEKDTMYMFLVNAVKSKRHPIIKD